MQYRHEWKHAINYADLLAIRRRLQAVAEPDPYAIDGKYRIRSLYFDTPEDKALLEKLNGTDRREKFRLRCYNGDLSLIHLEKKSKRNGLGTKEKAPLTVEETQLLLDGEIDWMRRSDRPLVQELGCKMIHERLRPQTIVDYVREPFIYAPGNVRVTFDYDIRTGLYCRDFLDPDSLTVPAGDAPIIMEVKWDAFLPSIIQDAVQMPGRRASAFSKYAQCRIYG